MHIIMYMMTLKILAFTTDFTCVELNGKKGWKSH